MTEFICYDSLGNIIDSDFDETMAFILYDDRPKTLNKLFSLYSMIMGDEIAERHLQYAVRKGFYIYSYDCEAFVLV